MMIDVDNPVIELTAADRCESKCGAQAVVLARNEDIDHEMLFCAHHARDHRDKLLDLGYALITDGVQAEAQGYSADGVLVV